MFRVGRERGRVVVIGRMAVRTWASVGGVGCDGGDDELVGWEEDPLPLELAVETLAVEVGVVWGREGNLEIVREGGSIGGVLDCLGTVLVMSLMTTMSTMNVHSGNSTQQYPFCCLAVTSECFIGNPANQLLADVQYSRNCLYISRTRWLVRIGF